MTPVYVRLGQHLGITCLILRDLQYSTGSGQGSRHPWHLAYN